MALKEHILSFCKSSAIRGLARAFRVPFGFVRLLWCVAVVVGGAVAGWYIAKLLVRYYSYQTNTNMQKITQYTDFPDITVCNLQPFRSTLPHNFLQYLETRHEEIVERLWEPHPEQDTWGASYDKGYFSTLRGLYQNVPKHFYDFLFTDPGELFVHCSWHGWIDQGSKTVYCKSQDFSLAVHPDNAACYRVRLSKNHTELAPKSVQGLKLILFLDGFFNYSFTKVAVSRYVGPWQGASIHIHERDSYFNVYNKLLFQPGVSAVVELARQSRSVLPAPYGHCDKNTHNNLSDGTNTTFKYSAESCIGFCIQELYIKNCNCVAPDLPVTMEMFVHMPFCGNLTHFEALGYTKEKIFSKLVGCHKAIENSNCAARCKEPCESTSFFSTVHQASWPHPAYHLQFYHKVISSRLPAKKEQFSIYENITNLMNEDVFTATKLLQETDLISKNFVEIEVRLSSPLVTVLQEFPALTADGILGTVGGLLNLWIGISFVTMFEVLELLYNVLQDLVFPKNKTSSEPTRWADKPTNTNK